MLDLTLHLDLWMEYISFLKSMPTTTAQESHRMTSVRKVYQKAIVTPTHHVEQLWKDYENFENSISSALAKGLLSEYQPKFNSARAIYRERKKYIDDGLCLLFHQLVPARKSSNVWHGKGSWHSRRHPYHTDGLTCLSITSDSTVAITGSKDSSVHMVNITTGRVISSLTAHANSVECIGLSPSSPWAATGGMDQKLIIWDLQRSAVRCSCDHEEGVTCLTWVGTSQYVATGCVNGKVRIWDSLSGNCLRTFSGHADTIQSLAMSADGNSLVSVSNDGTARVFGISEFR